MSKEKLKKVTAEISEDALVVLKILALKKRVTLGEYLAEALEKHTQSKGKLVDDVSIS